MFGEILVLCTGFAAGNLGPREIKTGVDYKVKSTPAIVKARARFR